MGFAYALRGSGLDGVFASVEQWPFVVCGTGFWSERKPAFDKLIFAFGDAFGSGVCLQKSVVEAC